MRKSCVSPEGRFQIGVHKPSFNVKNLRKDKAVQKLGALEDGSVIDNAVNFPDGDLFEPEADLIYEIPNPFPFRGTTYINSRWAEAKVNNPKLIRLPEQMPVSFKRSIGKILENTAEQKSLETLYEQLPAPVLYSLAQTSTDPDDLVILARLSCRFELDPQTGEPKGLMFESDPKGNSKPLITNHTLFEIVVNNHFLPDIYKEAMVLRPGIQGNSEIVAEWNPPESNSHIFEYLRRNSYIPWGHYAANMANDAIRYRMRDLSLMDLKGLRFLYYQRTYCRVSADLGLGLDDKNQSVDQVGLEQLRLKAIAKLRSGTHSSQLSFNRTLWGWNFGFDYAPSEYRLHASHQQIHQQYAMVPEMVETETGEMPAYACGDLIEDFVTSFQSENTKAFFPAYLKAIQSNQRVDGREDKENSLVVYEDGKVLLFVPKAQTSQWELQLMTLSPIGNILEADTDLRESLDMGIYLAVQTLSALGARMITSIEYSKRFEATQLDQRLLYAFLPRLPESPGAFSEAQLRWINGHYPEDFALACRQQMSKILEGI